MTTPPGDPWEPRETSHDPTPSAPPPPPQPDVRERPQAVETAFRLWLINVAVGVVSSLIALTMMDQLINEALEQQNAQMTEEAAQAGIVVGIVIGLVLVAIWLAIAFQMRKGRNWARIVLAVLGGIGVIMSVIGMADAFSLPGVAGFTVGVLEIVSTLLVIAAIYFMFRPESNAYFSRQR